VSTRMRSFARSVMHRLRSTCSARNGSSESACREVLYSAVAGPACDLQGASILNSSLT
jgi:hypothetical protein